MGLPVILNPCETAVPNEERIVVDGIDVAVARKRIRGLYLRVDRHSGQLRVSAPRRLSAKRIRAFVASKRAWIEQKQAEARQTPAETRPQCVSGEVLYLWGKGYPLAVVECPARPTVELHKEGLVMRVRPGTDTAKRRQILDAWYREQLRAAIPPLLQTWTPILGVAVAGFSLRRMKTRWGSCNPARATIRVNTKLATKPAACLEFLVVHELIHLLEPSHNKRFHSLMDHFLPAWRKHSRALSDKKS